MKLADEKRCLKRFPSHSTMSYRQINEPNLSFRLICQEVEERSVERAAGGCPSCYTGEEEAHISHDESHLVLLDSSRDAMDCV